MKKRIEIEQKSIFCSILKQQYAIKKIFKSRKYMLEHFPQFFFLNYYVKKVVSFENVWFDFVTDYIFAKGFIAHEKKIYY